MFILRAIHGFWYIINVYIVTYIYRMKQLTFFALVAVPPGVTLASEIPFLPFTSARCFLSRGWVESSSSPLLLLLFLLLLLLRRGRAIPASPQRCEGRHLFLIIRIRCSSASTYAADVSPEPLVGASDVSPEPLVGAEDVVARGIADFRSQVDVGWRVVRVARGISDVVIARDVRNTSAVTVTRRGATDLGS